MMNYYMRGSTHHTNISRRSLIWYRFDENMTSGQVFIYVELITGSWPGENMSKV